MLDNTYRPEIPVVLTIAGSDSSGGAGIQADLKTITLLGGYGASVITALTAQNTCGVFAIEAPPASFVAKQLEVVREDLEVQAVKTGMLFNAEIILKLAPLLKKMSVPLVVDPVCVSQSGHKLLQDKAIEVLKKEILPLATLLTPNIPEAELLSGVKLESRKDIPACLKSLFALGCQAILLKGGHFFPEDGQEVVDILAFPEGKTIEFKSPKVFTSNNHGTGCTLSAAIATFLAKGMDIPLSVAKAREFLLFSLKKAYALGKGAGPVNHLAKTYQEVNRYRALEDLWWLKKKLLTEKLGFLVPEVRMNMVRLIPYAQDKEDVAGFEGRISVDKEGRLLWGEVLFGVSSHMARVVLTAAQYDPRIVLAANIRYSPRILEAIRKIGYPVFTFNREDEPKEVKEKEGSTLEWGVAKVFAENKGQKIEFIADPGEKGKEPMIRVLAYSKEDLLGKLKQIGEAY